MGLPNKPLEHTRPETIAMQVNKPREAQSLWELPTLRPPGGDRAVGRDIIYKIILYSLLLYIELRETQTATITFSSMLQFTPDCTHCTEFDGWTLIGCYVTHVTQLSRCWTLIGCHHDKNLSPVFSREKFVRYASLCSLCMGSCRPYAFGLNAQCASSSAAPYLLRSEPKESSVCVTSWRICRDQNR